LLLRAHPGHDVLNMFVFYRRKDTPLAHQLTLYYDLFVRKHKHIRNLPLVITLCLCLNKGVQKHTHITAKAELIFTKVTLLRTKIAARSI
jgi:hypothetical protein